MPSRMGLTLFEEYTRYSNEQAQAATKRYVQLAKKYQLTATQLALAYVNSRPFLGANIFGATSIEQLKENIESIGVKLTQEIIDEIELIYREIPNPSP